jgi:hypothetical protein
MIESTHLRTYVIEPVLRDAQLHSEAAVNLLLGTAAQESHMGTYFAQIRGPAVGIFQMEPATHDDIWGNFLKYKDAKPYTKLLNNLASPYSHRAEILFWNLRYAALMCRVHYLRKPGALPDADDIRGLGEYWKKHYNTPLGAGTVDEFVGNYHRFVLKH